MTSWKSDHAQPFGLLSGGRLITRTWFAGLFPKKRKLENGCRITIMSPHLVLSVRKTARLTAFLRPTGILELANLLVSTGQRLEFQLCTAFLNQ